MSCVAGRLNIASQVVGPTANIGRIVFGPNLNGEDLLGSPSRPTHSYAYPASAAGMHQTDLDVPRRGDRLRPMTTSRMAYAEQ